METAIHNGQAAGGKKLADKAEDRKREILQKNKTLVEKIGTRPWNASSVASKIYKQWDEIPSGGHIGGEDPKLTCRGDGQKKPAVRTIRDWLKPEK